MKMLAAIASLLFVASTAPALAASDWNGTWAGNWQNGDGIQLVMSGNDAIALYLQGDYVSDDLHATVSTDGKTLSVAWDHARAVFTRIDDDDARAVLSEPGHADLQFAVKRDR